MKNNKKGFIVVSGCPRSGTSLMMDILRAIFGLARIMGLKFPQKQREEEDKEELKDNQNFKYNKDLIDYFAEKNELIRKSQMTPEQLKDNDSEDMNPNGFWECQFTIQGIRWMFQLRNILKKSLEDWKIVKVVSQGLLNSDPQYINRVIYMLRHPRAVAKSQERLKRIQMIKTDSGEDVNLFDAMGKIHTPEMFITVTTQALMFFKNNKDIPIKIVNFEDLVESPKTIIKQIYDFIGIRGKVTKGYDIVEPKLNRSKHEDIENRLWGDADYLYGVMSQIKLMIDAGEQEKIYELIDRALEFIRDPKREINKENFKFWVYGAGVRVSRQL